MAFKLTRKLKRSVKRWAKNKTFVLTMAILLVCTGVIVYAGYMENKRLSVDPASYSTLLQLIARAESNDNYNAYFNNAENTSIKFTEMTIAEVLSWQAKHVEAGNYSSAVGRYQIVNTTLSGLVRQLGIDASQKFDQPTQDRLAVALFERRGSEKYVNDELTREEFAANLAMEWAALPKVLGENPADSYYAGDGLNKSRISVDEILKAVDSVGPR